MRTSLLPTGEKAPCLSEHTHAILPSGSYLKCKYNPLETLSNLFGNRIIYLFLYFGQ